MPNLFNLFQTFAFGFRYKFPEKQRGDKTNRGKGEKSGVHAKTADIPGEHVGAEGIGAPVAEGGNGHGASSDAVGENFRGEHPYNRANGQGQAGNIGAQHNQDQQCRGLLKGE